MISLWCYTLKVVLGMLLIKKSQAIIAALLYIIQSENLYNIQYLTFIYVYEGRLTRILQG